jgi:hypothetical protein
MSSRTLKKASSFVLSRPSSCNVPSGYASDAALLAASPGGLFEHPDVEHFLGFPSWFMVFMVFDV